jgi:hypothetical protein
MEAHWRSGYSDAVRTLRHPEVLQRPNGRDGFFTFDLERDGQTRNDPRMVDARGCTDRQQLTVSEAD